MESLKKQRELLQDMHDNQNKADGIEVTYYTDPLCCWSWALEPHWRRLQYELQDKLRVRYVMSGLLPSWKNYNDTIYSVSRPMQMGPVWLEAGVTSGMPVYDKIWVYDPPASSYPACIAVKAVQLQSQHAAVVYLRLLREAVMMHGQNIAKQDVLIEIAEKMLNDQPSIFDLSTLKQDLINDNGLEAFRKDWQETGNRDISRFPTLIIRAPNKPAILLTGYRPYSVLREAIKQIAPDIEVSTQPISREDYKRFWRSLTDRELQEIGLSSLST
jgi:predicted DsbA family dithiol-disulfide isomerase